MAGKLVGLSVAGIALLAAIYMALGMPGMDHTGSGGVGHDMPAMNSTAVIALRELDPPAFEKAMAAPRTEVINVHTPYDGEIAGTDSLMAFDAVDQSRLPADKNAAIVLYCRSGRMSEIAGRELLALGYNNVSHLVGGMIAWTESGRAVVSK